MRFLLAIAVPQDASRGNLRTTELAHRLGLPDGCPSGFAIDRQVGVMCLPLWRLRPARFVSAAALCFPPSKDGGQDLIQMFLLSLSSHMAIGHLAGHLLSTSRNVLCQLARPVATPFRRSAERF